MSMVICDQCERWIDTDKEIPISTSDDMQSFCDEDCLLKAYEKLCEKFQNNKERIK